jgi:hypothetical protein
MSLGVQSAFTIKTIETADLAVGRQEIDAQRDAKASAVDRPKNGRRINNSAHFGGKGTKKLKVES